MLGTPYRTPPTSTPHRVHARWLVRTKGLWMTAFSVLLLGGSCALYEPRPTFFCERTHGATHCWYYDDAAYFPSVRSLDGIEIRVERDRGGSAEGLYRIDARTSVLVTGSSQRDVLIPPTLHSNGGAVTDPFDAATAFFAGRAGPRFALRLGGYDMGQLAMFLCALFPMLMLWFAIIVAVIQLALARRLVVDPNARRVSLSSPLRTATVDLANDETLLVVNKGDDLGIVVVDEDDTKRSTELGDGLTRDECTAVVHATKRALAAKPPRATLRRPALAMLFVLSACSVVYCATKRPAFPQRWARIAPQ